MIMYLHLLSRSQRSGCAWISMCEFEVGMLGMYLI